MEKILKTLFTFHKKHLAGFVQPSWESFTYLLIFVLASTSNLAGTKGGNTPPGKDTTPPTVPGGLVAHSISATQIDLAWLASTDASGVAGYIVYREGRQIATTTQPSFSDVSVTGGSTFCYSVAAYDARNNTSSKSSLACTATPTPLPAPVPCAFSLSGSSSSFAASGGTGSVSVTTDPGCTWDISGLTSWITITSGASGTGTGTVNFSVQANAATVSRSTTLLVAGQSFLVSQEASPCSYSLSTPNAAVNATGGNVTIGVNASGSCVWSVSGLPNWILLNSSASAGGSGTVSLSVQPNATTSSRSASITIAGQSFLIAQEAAALCTYALNASDAAFESSGGSGSVTVSTSPNCAWNVGGLPNWINLLSNSSWIGGGTLYYSVQPNIGTSSRSGSFAIAGQTFTITQKAAPCTYTLSAFESSFSASGGPGSVSVTALSGCAWSVTALPNWVTLSSISNGSGSAVITYSVLVNTSTSSRSASLTIAGQAYTVKQAAALCVYSLSASSTSFPYSGGSGSLNVMTSSTCPWSIAGLPSWIVASSGISGIGGTTVSFTVQPNASTVARSATLAVAGQSLTLTQGAAACTYSLSSGNSAFSASGGSGSVSVNAAANCPWSVSGLPSWISFPGGMDGNGSSSLSYTVSINTGSLPRTATITIAGQPYTVTQDAAVCVYGLSSTTDSAPAAGSTGIVNVTAGSNCQWTVSGFPTWILLGSSATTTGSGTAAYLVQPNTSTQTRTAKFTIAGQAFTVSQAAAACTFNLSSSGYSFPDGGGSIDVAVTTSANCPWTVSNPVSWVTVSQGSTGPGNVTLRVMANLQPDSRVATLTIAGNPFIVNQTAAPPSYSNTWVQSFGGTANDAGMAVAVDSAGYIYSAGSFNGTATFGTGTFVSAGQRDTFIVKSSANGVIQWVRTFGSTGDEAIKRILVNASGNIYVCGSFSGLGNFGGASVLSAGGLDGYIAKYSPDGKFIWSRTLGGIYSDSVLGIALDATQQNVIATGLFCGTVTFTPSATFSSRSAGQDSFLAQYSAADGSPVWAKTFTNMDFDAGLAVFVDKGNNIILVGNFAYAINLGLGLVYANGSTYQNDIYIAKFPPSSGSAPTAPLWVQRFGGPGSETIYSAALDSNGDIFVGGLFTSRQTDLGNGLLVGTAYDGDIFLAKYSGLDGHALWSRAMTCTQSGAATALAVDSVGDAVVGGYFFKGTCQIGAQSFSAVGGSYDAFAAKFTGSSGEAIWAETFGGFGSETCSDVALDSADFPVFIGTYEQSANFSGATLTSKGLGDVFLLRIDP